MDGKKKHCLKLTTQFHFTLSMRSMDASSPFVEFLLVSIQCSFARPWEDNLAAPYPT
jgi:hypothetical protein